VRSIGLPLGRFTLTSVGVTYRSRFLRVAVIEWVDISAVGYKRRQFFTIKANNGQVANVPILVRGLREFAVEIKRHVPKNKMEPNARDLLDDLANGEFVSFY
jgi:hypothetical protein